MSYRTEPDHAAQAKAVASNVAAVVKAAADLQTAVAHLLNVVANPAQMILIDPNPGQQEEIRKELEKSAEYVKTQQRLWRDALSPSTVPVESVPTTPHGVVQWVLRTNGVPFEYIEVTNDYVLTEHVVSPDLTEFMRQHLGDEGWTATGQVAGPPADLRKRPDLFRRPSPQQQAEQVPASNIPPTFDGTYPNPRTEVKVVDKVPNAGDQ